MHGQVGCQSIVSPVKVYVLQVEPEADTNTNDSNLKLATRLASRRGLASP